MKDISKQKPIGAGKSSFELIDPEKVFGGELQLKNGSTFLDIGCGKGLYSIAASNIVGEKGLIYAVDLWEEGITILQEQILERGIKNIKAIIGDASNRIEIESSVIDVCLMAVVLHDFVQLKAVDGVLREIGRVLKPQGVLAILEFKKIEGPPGPPIKIRLSADEVVNIIIPYGFKKEGFVDVGSYNYLITFSVR